VNDLDRLFDLLRSLVLIPSPPGREEQMDAYLQERLQGRGDVRRDAAGNVILHIAGRGERAPVAILAHKDEIAVGVKRVEPDGRLRLVPIGGAFPWVWGETPLLLLGDHATVTGVLSFGARHVSKESPQRRHVEEKALRWDDTWIETKLEPDDLAAAGVRPGTRAVLAGARREPVRIGAGGAFVAAPRLDDVAAVAAVLLLAERLASPAADVDLVLSTREEIGAHGALFYTRAAGVADVVAVEVAPVAEEYAIAGDERPVLIEGDAHTVLNDELGRELAAAAAGLGLELQHAFLAGYGSDASAAYSAGTVARAACLAVAAHNTHGCEIVHLESIDRCARILAAWLAQG
jgi:putative aminopeptidase FrvX